jgi:hypothetical protein
MSYWVAGAAVGSAVIGASSSNSASKAQQGAAGEATALQRDQYNSTVERNQPFLQAGTDALSMLQSKLPSLNAAYDPNKLTSEPGYQFGLQQGQQALERSLAARGRGVSGAALKSAAQYGTDYGTTKLNDAFNRDSASKNQQFSQLMQLTGLGQASANNTSAAGQNYANAAGTNLVNAADSAGANAIGQGNIFSGLLNQGASMYNRNNSKPGSSFDTYDASGYGMPGAYNTATGGSYHAADNYGDAIPLAEGGPVRAEPRVGTRTPLPAASTGGGMSRDAILAALTEAHQQGQAAPAQQFNPNNLPLPTARGLRAAGEYAAGGAIRGPGGPKDDVVPVMASNGEHMFDEASVTALGDGDNEKGQALLNEMRARIKAHAAGKKGKH